MKDSYIKQAFWKEFDKNFLKIKREPIVLYGTGRYTKWIIENPSHYNVVGLMDKKASEMAVQHIYGLPVLAERDVCSSCKVMIIAASISVSNKIYNQGIS